MPIREDLRRYFLNPPKGGNQAGAPTTNRMALVPVPQSGGGGIELAGGENLAEQRKRRQLAAINARVDLDDTMRAELREEVEREAERERDERQRAVSGPMAQPALRASLEAGEDSARRSVVRSSRVGQTEFRNFTRERTPTQLREDDPQGPDHYDFEQTSEGAPTAASGFDGGPLRQKPALTLEPDTEPRNRYRSDGKRPNTTRQITGR